MTTKETSKTTQKQTQEQKVADSLTKKRAAIQLLLDYATKNYNCVFPKDTLKVLSRIEGITKFPTTQSIDGLVDEWNVWKEYLDEESFSNFILDGLKSLLSINATTTSTSRIFGDFVGNKAKIVKELPSSLSTAVSLNGILRIDGRKVIKKR